MPSRFGDWMETYTGRRFSPLDPRPEDVALRDIAHALSLQCRFAGHCRYLWTVADHCLACHQVACDRGLGKRMQLLALLHDAHEAYTGDLIRPVKRSLQVISRGVGDTESAMAWWHAEARVQRAIWKAFGVDPPTFTEEIEIRQIDDAVLATEALYLHVSGGASWNLYAKPIPSLSISPTSYGERRGFYEYHVSRLVAALNPSTGDRLDEEVQARG